MSESAIANVPGGTVQDYDDRLSWLLPDNDGAPLSYVASFPKPAPDASLAEKIQHAEKVMPLMSKADYRVSESRDDKINMVHFLVHPVHMIDRETGEVNGGDRIVILDNEGASYECVSTGVFDSLRLLMALLGHPSTWTEPVPVTFREIETGNKRRMYKLEVWSEKKAKVKK